MLRHFLLLSLLLLISACAGSYYTERSGDTERVYKFDEEGNKHLIYVKKGDQLTVHDSTDPKAKEALNAQRYRKAARQREADRLARLKKAPKRGPKEPIRVALFKAELGPKLVKSESSKGAVDRQIRKHFANDPILKLSDMAGRQRHEKLKSKGFHFGTYRSTQDADVDVKTKVYFKEIIGRNKKTGKIGKGVVLMYEATVASNFYGKTYTVKDSAGLFQNVAGTKRFCDKIKSIIKNKIGPTIPKDRTGF